MIEDNLVWDPWGEYSGSGRQDFNRSRGISHRARPFWIVLEVLNPGHKECRGARTPGTLPGSGARDIRGHDLLAQGLGVLMTRRTNSSFGSPGSSICSHFLETVLSSHYSHCGVEGIAETWIVHKESWFTYCDVSAHWGYWTIWRTEYTERPLWTIPPLTYQIALRRTQFYIELGAQVLPD